MEILSKKTINDDNFLDGVVETPSSKLDKIAAKDEEPKKKPGRPKGSKTKANQKQEIEQTAQMLAQMLSMIFAEKGSYETSSSWAMSQDEIQYGANCWAQAVVANNIQLNDARLLFIPAVIWTIGSLFKRRQYFSFGGKLKQGWYWLKGKIWS